MTPLRLLLRRVLPMMAIRVGLLESCLRFLIGLAVSYLRIVIGPRFATREAAGAQFVYPVLFSYAYFSEGITGLAVTIGAIGTLFLVMQMTARPLERKVPARAASNFTALVTKPRKKAMIDSHGEADNYAQRVYAR